MNCADTFTVVAEWLAHATNAPGRPGGRPGAATRMVGQTIVRRSPALPSTNFLKCERFVNQPNR